MTGTVLVADDSTVVRAVLREQLTQQGFVVIEAADGAEALVVCRRELPDIVLLDVDMPLLTGHEVLVELRAGVGTRDIPVVFLTGRVDVADAVEGLRLGAHDYLRKPVEPIELIARVAAALRTKHLQDELRRSNAELSHISRTDPLTGLHNRRHVEELLVNYERRSMEYDEPISVIMIDIDHFKAVNDTWGHAAGDDSLRAVAEVLAGATHGTEVVGRWGGEEFLVLLPTVPVATAQLVAHRMRMAIQAAAIHLSSGERVSLTISAGCAAGVGHLENLVRQADRALYEAKSAGRNAVRAARSTGE